MKDELRLLLLKIIYEKLGLSEIEDEMKSMGIVSKEIANPDGLLLVSEYFFLKNDVILSRLSEAEEQELTQYYLDYKKQDRNDIIKDDLRQFLEKNMLKLLLLDTEEEDVFWGPIHRDFQTKNDVIALAVHFLEFDNDRPMTEEQADFFYNAMNYIQFELGPKAGIRVATLLYNEVVEMYKC